MSHVAPGKRGGAPFVLTWPVPSALFAECDAAVAAALVCAASSIGQLAAPVS